LIASATAAGTSLDSSDQASASALHTSAVRPRRLAEARERQRGDELHRVGPFGLLDAVGLGARCGDERHTERQTDRREPRRQQRAQPRGVLRRDRVAVHQLHERMQHDVPAR
jgi:hypothetical protein